MVKKKPAMAPLDVVAIPPIKLETVQIQLVGVTSLITNAWTTEKMDQIERPAERRAHAARPAREPTKEFEDSKYRLPDGRLGLPSTAFKKAAVNACRLIDGLPMTEARVLFHVLGELVPIEGEARPRRDAVPIPGGKGWTVIYRAEFLKWKCGIQVRYFANKISAEQVVNLFNLAGLGGVGCFRADSPMGKSGNHGMFQVAMQDAMV